MTTPGAYAAENQDQTHALQKAFNAVAEHVYPAVVSITTIQVKRVAGDRYYVPFGQSLFNNFLGEMFGLAPDGTRPTGRSYFERRTGVGSGIIVSDNGYILTNYHLISDAEGNQVTVRLTNGKEYTGIVIGADASYDLALIKINERGLHAASLVDSDQVHVGDWAIAIGNPYGFIFDDAQPTMTVGVVSALNRSLPGIVGQSKAYRELIQTDASINLGNSGGPLVTIDGKVMGINVALVSTTGGNQGIGFAIPSNHCENLLARYVEGKKTAYTWLGVEAQNLTRDLAAYFKVNVDYGVVVMRTIPGSPADKAGLAEGDVLVTYEGKTISNLDTLFQYIDASHVSETITITYIRDGAMRRATVILAQRPASAAEFEKMQSLYWRGLRPENATQVLREQYRLPAVDGVVITDIQPGSAADEGGLIVGDLIVKVNQQEVTKLDEFYAATENMTEDALVKTLRGYFVVKKPESKA